MTDRQAKLWEVLDTQAHLNSLNRTPSGHYTKISAFIKTFSKALSMKAVGILFVIFGHP